MNYILIHCNSISMSDFSFLLQFCEKCLPAFWKKVDHLSVIIKLGFKSLFLVRHRNVSYVTINIDFFFTKQLLNCICY